MICLGQAHDHAIKGDAEESREHQRRDDRFGAVLSPPGTADGLDVRPLPQNVACPLHGGILAGTYPQNHRRRFDCLYSRTHLNYVVHRLPGQPVWIQLAPNKLGVLQIPRLGRCLNFRFGSITDTFDCPSNGFRLDINKRLSKGLCNLSMVSLICQTCVETEQAQISSHSSHLHVLCGLSPVSWMGS